MIMQDIYDVIIEHNMKNGQEALRAEAIKFLEEYNGHRIGISVTERDAYCYFRAASELEKDDAGYRPIVRMLRNMYINIPFVPDSCPTVFRFADDAIISEQGSLCVPFFQGTLSEWYAKHHQRYIDALKLWVEE